MAPMRLSRLMLSVAALMVAFELAGCASGPLGSHGVDYIPAFDNAPPDASLQGRLTA
jgi:predicted small lipoprotein YifL